MRWISEQISDTRALVPPPGSDHAARLVFLRAVDQLTQAVAERPGVEGALIAYEGLLVASSPEGLDAGAAVSQLLLASASRASVELELGELQQTLVVGARRKVAIITLGPFSLGVVAPSRTDLAAALD